MENGPSFFDIDSKTVDYESPTSELERFLGKKEVEIAFFVRLSGRN